MTEPMSSAGIDLTLEVRGLALLPTDLTLPGVEVDSTVALDFHKHGVNIPGVGDLVVYIPRIPDVHTPSIDPDPFPFPLGSSVSKQWKTAVEIPTSFKFSKDALTIPSTLNFNVFLVWHPANGRLGIDVRPA